MSYLCQIIVIFYKEEHMSVYLYDIKNGNDWFSLSADIRDGCLVLEGCDFCGLAESMFGSDEYEYYYYFSEENTVELAEALSTQDLLASLVQFFDGKNRNKEFLAFCNEHDIDYSFSSWH